MYISARMDMNTDLTMICKYWWLVVFAVSVFLFDALLMQWIELMATEQDMLVKHGFG